MECHKCQFNGKGDPRCIQCAAGAPDIPLNHHGRNAVGLDEIAGTRYEPRTAPEPVFQGEEPEAPPVHAPAGVYLSAAAADLLAAFLRRMATLTQRELLVLARRVEAANSTDGRPTLAEIGAELGVSKQLVKHDLGNIAAKVPELLELFPSMRQTPTRSQRRLARRSADSGPRQQFLPLEWPEDNGGATQRKGNRKDAT